MEISIDLIIKEPEQQPKKPEISETEIRKDILKYLQENQAKIREEAFKVVFSIMKNQEDSQHSNTLDFVSKQISFFINEKNLKIQMLLIEIVEILIEKSLLVFKDNEKMFCYFWICFEKKPIYYFKKR